MRFIRKHIFLIILIGFSLLALFVNIRINVFRYTNFDYGKFDLGNMSQMLWNTLHGRFLYLTDYFGTNMPRWSMSHVDPILLLFLPLFALIQSPMTLVFAQLVLVIFSGILIYLIAKLELKSELAALLIAIAYLLYPALGFLTAWTGFHGVTASIPFFLAAFYLFEYMYHNNKFSRKGWLVFWLLLVITMAGKEQVPLYIVSFGAFLLFFRTGVTLTNLKAFDIKAYLKHVVVKQALAMIVIGLLWFGFAFFILIPAYAHYRIDGFEKFAKSLSLDTSISRDVSGDNYFISRYEAFGDSYSEVAINMLLNPKMLIRVFFGGDKLENFTQTFLPVGYLPFLSPQTFVMAFPDLLINYSTTAGGIGTSEITNHRISMIVPVVFISTIFSVRLLGDIVAYLGTLLFKKKLNYFRFAVIGISGMLVVLGVHTTFAYNNPVYLWLTQAVQKRVMSESRHIVYAKEDKETAENEKLKIGDVLKLSKLENKDRECANKVIKLIPDNASVSGPDYLGAHLSLRETYAIFPALYNEADYIIVDVFSKKILTILDVDLSLVRTVVENLIRDPNYDLQLGCGNLFVFKRVGPHNKSDILPLQEKFDYPEKMNMELFQSVHIVDYALPKEILRGKTQTGRVVYIKRDNNSLNDYVLFMSYINADTGAIYQVANLPTFALVELKDWTEDHYFIEDISVNFPTYLEAGRYKAFVGMSNVIRSRSIYLGDIQVL